jgi:hypothetical protein
MAVILNSQNLGISPIASETRGVSAETGFLNSFILMNLHTFISFEFFYIPAELLRLSQDQASLGNLTPLRRDLVHISPPVLRRGSSQSHLSLARTCHLLRGPALLINRKPYK